VLDLRSYLPYLINRVGFAVTDVFGEALAAENLTVPMWRVLAVLLYHGPQRIGDLADLTSIEISTLSRLLGTMQRRKLLTRKRARTDARVVMAALTERGRALTDALVPAATDLETSLAGDLGADEIAGLKRTLDKLYANISVRAAERRLKA
jgi:MarR family transcriptional regulator, lower aerobic nicotinate degradation pathway regulator